ncbi:hypothetical protein J6590_019106 [Homalodisca vitripennis]|nr:hypothetical protein J6590_019106 [Homalodisca vitripennis]
MEQVTSKLLPLISSCNQLTFADHIQPLLSSISRWARLGEQVPSRAPSRLIHQNRPRANVKIALFIHSYAHCRRTSIFYECYSVFVEKSRSTAFVPFMTA